MNATQLETVPIGSCETAPQRLGQIHRYGNVTHVPVVFQPTRGCSPYIIVPKGFIGLVGQHGRYVGQWQAGLKWCAPWVQISHLVPTQLIIYDTPVKECPTQDNVMVTIDVTLTLRINTNDEKALHDFCYTLGPRGLDDMLKAFQEEAIRGMARKRKYNEIYDMMDAKHDKQLEGTLRDLNNHFNQYGVIVFSIAVTGVHLPREFAQTMQEATIWHNRDEFKKLEQSYKLKVIETREREAKEKQTSKEDLEKFEAGKDREVAEMQKRKALVLAETRKQLAVIRELEQAEVLEIKSKSQLEVSQINSKRDIEKSKIQSQGLAEADMIKIEAETYVKTKSAKTKAIVAANEAECLKLKSDAEAGAAIGLQPKRSYEERMRQLQTLRAVSVNNNVAVVGNSKDNILAQLLANQASGAVLGINSK